MKKQRQFRTTTWNPRAKFNGRAHIEAMYDSVWESYRLRFLRENPWCYACGAQATVVDHLEPHKGDEKLFKKLDNHIPSCAKCHNTITTKFDRNHKPGTSIIGKLKWIAGTRSNNRVPSTVKVLPKYED